jgi:3-hydroxymyristoyl/3-hydroxydecanoyl-(acyl carrier protein) dehydratase
MDESARAFSFVNRILSCEPGGHIRGRYRIPSGIGHFPLSLVAEAVGQLAAWSAMAAVGFQRRPVAGIAGGVELLGVVHPGQTLELGAELETADNDAVAYGGSASVEGVPILRLTHCVGPMVPMEEFDDPAAVRSRFERLHREGTASGGFQGLPPLSFERAGGETGQVARATFVVPSSSDFFADHFPRRPVFPGSLLLHANLQLAAQLVNELPSPEPMPGARTALSARSQLNRHADKAVRAPGDGRFMALMRDLGIVEASPEPGSLPEPERRAPAQQARAEPEPGVPKPDRESPAGNQASDDSCREPIGSAPRWRPRSVSNMKLRAFIPPGEILELEARLGEASDRAVVLVVETRRGRRLLSNGCVTFVAEGSP